MLESFLNGLVNLERWVFTDSGSISIHAPLSVYLHINTYNSYEISGGMDKIGNPVSPGAGSPPPELAGRDGIIEQTRVLLGRVPTERPEKSLLLTSLRGFEKTVGSTRSSAWHRGASYTIEPTFPQRRLFRRNRPSVSYALPHSEIRYHNDMIA